VQAGQSRAKSATTAITQSRFTPQQRGLVPLHTSGNLMSNTVTRRPAYPSNLHAYDRRPRRLTFSNSTFTRAKTNSRSSRTFRSFCLALAQSSIEARIS
jgi:hypothetical protein